MKLIKPKMEGKEKCQKKKTWDTIDLGDWEEIERLLELVQRISMFMSFLLGSCVSTLSFSQTGHETFPLFKW